LKHIHGSILLALVLSAAAPAFADKIAANLDDGVPGIHFTRGFSDEKALRDASSSRSFGLGILGDNEFRIESDSAVRKGELRIDSLRWDDEKAQEKFKKLHLDDADDGEGSPSAAAIPEPGSLTLVLFGMVVLGIVVYRHNTPANTI
jgi:PEP-CTERM motif-containing protein